MKKMLLVCFICMVFSGCSMILAVTGKETKNMGSIDVGTSRSAVIMNLGQPAKTSIIDNVKVDIFELQRGNDPSIGRAALHGAMDLMTFGAWEIIGTPMEAMQGKSFTLTVEYDENDKVKTFSSNDL